MKKKYAKPSKNIQKYAMKTFRPTKSSKKLRKEYELQEKAAIAGISPKVYDYDTVSKYILMERMDGHLFLGHKTTRLTKAQQLRIIYILKKLDEIGVFHDDINLLNFNLK